MTNGNDSITATVLKIDQGEIILTGLTKREQLAAMAMQGLLANSEGAMDENGRKVFSPSSISRIACLHADALINALNK